MITDVLTLYYGGHLVIRGEISGGALVSFLLYSLSLGQAIEEIGDVYTGLVDAVGAAEKVWLKVNYLGMVVRRLDSANQRIAIFSSFSKQLVNQSDPN